MNNIEVNFKEVGCDITLHKVYVSLYFIKYSLYGKLFEMKL